MRDWFFSSACVALICAAAAPAPARAQSSAPVLQSEIPFEYSRGRNVSVLERPRPEYRAPGILAGGFTIYPSAELAPGYTNNVYSRPAKTSDAFVDVNPQVEVNSNWQRNRLTAAAGLRLRRFADETIKNEDGWFARLGGRAEIGLNTTIDGLVRAEKLYETRYSPSAAINVQSSAPYQVNVGRLVVQNSRGRVRLAASASYENYNFQSVQLAGGGTLSQDNRDRSVWTGAALAEYAVSPDTSVFAQIEYHDTNYKEDLSPGVANRDSRTTRGVAGVSLDVSSLIRGRIGLGYMVRNYDSPIYKDIKGLAAEVQLEYFPTPITTVTLTGRRRTDDASIGASSGYISTAANLRVDHELLRNLLLNAQLAYEAGTYKDINSTARIFRTSVGAKYLMSRTLSLRLDLGYGERNNRGALLGPSFNETRGQLTVSLRI